METDRMVDFVLREIVRYRKRDDIILELCEKTGRPWDEMKVFVWQVEHDNQAKLEAKRKPLLLVISMVTALLGLGGAAAILIATFNGLMIIFIFFPIPYLPNLLVFLAALSMGTRGTWGLIGLLRKNKAQKEGNS